MNNVSIKVCGMNNPANILAVSALDPDYMGFIFYPKSPRYAGELNPAVMQQVSQKICKVGVFVNETIPNILETVDKYHLQAVQLHGNEAPNFCKKIKREGICTIKALPVADKEDFDITKTYTSSCDYVLFDTKTDLYGGSGQKFDWSLLDLYKGALSFFLSGGIGPEDIGHFMQYQHIKMHAIDINSRFEISPGIKDVEQLTKAIRLLRL